jgi:YggT family protein
MFVLANLILALGKILDVLLSAYMWIIIISALISWVNPDPYNPVVRFLYAVTEPVLRRVRRIIGFRTGVIDLSPMIVILAIMFVKFFLIQSLIELAYKLKGGMIV